MKKRSTIILIIVVSIIVIATILVITLQNNTETNTKQNNAETQSRSQNQQSDISQSQLVTNVGLFPVNQQLSDMILPQLSGQANAKIGVSRDLILLVVWVSWCRYCIEEAPKLSQLETLLAPSDGITIQYISIDEDIEQAQEFILNYRLRSPVFHSPRAELINETPLRIRGTPANFLIYDGKLIAKKGGALDWSNPERQEALRILAKFLRENK